MSLDIRIPELSSTAGPNDDGVVLGSVNHTALTALWTNTQFAGTIYAVRRDVNGGVSFTDVSAVAASDAANDFAPWGTTAQMSAGDEFYVSCNDPIAEIFARIGTPGVWTGTGLEVAYSTDGRLANAVISGVTDGSNGFRAAAGVHRIQIPRPSDIKAFSPLPGTAADVAAGRAVAEREWYVIRPSGLTAVTTAPLLDRIWIKHETSAQHWVDFTTRVTGSGVNDTDFTGWPDSSFYAEGDTTIYVHPFLSYGMEIHIHRRRNLTLTRVGEYLASDDTWKALPDYTDPSNGYTNGPVNLGDPVEHFAQRWTIPTDWAEKSVTIKQSDGTDVTLTGYISRGRTTSVATYGPTPGVRVRIRTRAFGTANSNGFTFRTPKSISGVTFGSFRRLATGAVGVQLINSRTGRGTSFSIPSTASGEQPLHIALSPALDSVTEFLISHVSGAGLQSVDISLQDGA